MKKNTVLSLAVSVICLVILTFIEQYVKPGYTVKSCLKLLLLLVPMILYSFISRKKISDIIRLYKLNSARLLYIGMLRAYCCIIIVFLIFRNSIDLDQIRNNLMNKEHLTKQNCLYIFTYIIFVNSFIEEAFFRGFIYHLFETDNMKTVGIIVSAILFALYHIGIVSNWFNPLIFVICIAGLACCGMILQWVSLKFDTLKASWLIHGCANLAINTIGVIMIFNL
ncbi:MAG: CPBP family intramembrane metalloprotease [Erysipelotrichaceae bacterium]|nr:CPBP family intramembrane metalloprotease [Erysipelotrichaceae bacterium]